MRRLRVKYGMRRVVDRVNGKDLMWCGQMEEMAAGGDEGGE